MTSYETRSINTTRKTTSTEQNDLKKLKSKYSSKLPTLKAIFSDWSDDDLLFTLDEANGDLELAIDRISEGRATQWGEVKTKKSKKEAQKQKVATTAIPSHQQSSSTYHAPRETKPTQPQRAYNDRVNRSGKATTPTTSRARTTKPVASSWDNQPKSNYQEAAGSGSWASIASSKQLHNDSNANDNGWNTYTTEHTTTTEDDWAPAPTNNTNDGDQPKTWASLLKTKPKPEQETTEEEPVQTTINTTSEWDTPVISEWDAPTTTKINTPETSSATGWDAPAEPVDEWSTPVNVNESSSWDATPVTNEPEKEKEEKLDVSAQEEPVVLPANTSVNELDVKFGSLHVKEEPESTETITETTIIESTESVAQTTPATTTTTTIIEEVTVDASTNNTTANIPSPIKETTPVSAPVASNASEPLSQPSTTFAEPEPVQTQPTQTQPIQQQQQQQQQQPIQPQQVEPQQVQQTQEAPQPQPQPQPQQTQPLPPQQPQQQPQHQFGMDHLTSAYSSYLPNQPPAGISGFGMNPMGNLPEYSIYGTEAQRAAAMGYYDPTSFSHSPSVASASPYQTRDKYGQDMNGQAGGQSQTMPQHQMYPTNLPYYQYYYMPNQFSAYQQSAYGQPFMNKSNGYPNMYGQQQHQQQQSVKPTTATTSTAASAVNSNVYGNGSPYGNPSPLYQSNNSSNVGGGAYDDLGLQDYQKSLYSNGQPQLQGFLGNLTNNSTSAQQQQQAGQQQQTSQKSDLGRATPQSQAQPHHQQAQPQYNNGNYFGQPQMFSYQQYPQYQQQMPRQQQQYWNQ